MVLAKASIRFPPIAKMTPSHHWHRLKSLNKHFIIKAMNCCPRCNQELWSIAFIMRNLFNDCNRSNGCDKITEPPKAMDRQMFESMTRQIGIDFEFVTREENQKWRSTVSSTYQPDPDVAYLVEASSNRSDCDAVLLYKGNARFIYWGYHSKASIRKILQNSATECVVCYEDTQIGPNTVDCPQCTCRICVCCMMRLWLKPPLMRNVGRGEFTMAYKCVGCRELLGYDVRIAVCAIMHQRHKFSTQQQKMLDVLKATHPNFEHEHRKVISAFKRTKMLRSRQFRKGCRVKLHGLQRENWNDETGDIIGEMIIKDDVIRWPVRLLNGSNARALLKQINMKKVWYDCIMRVNC